MTTVSTPQRAGTTSRRGRVGAALAAIALTVAAGFGIAAGVSAIQDEPVSTVSESVRTDRIQGHWGSPSTAAATRDGNIHRGSSN